MEQLFSLEYMVSILLSGISLGGQLALIAIGYTMVYGILRLINFAHGDVFMVAGLLGIYISAVLPIYAAIPVVIILTVALDVTSGLIVWPKVIGAHVKEQLPFMATENILMECVKAGGDRQELHEAIRVHSMEAARVYKEEGKPFDLLEVAAWARREA